MDNIVVSGLPKSEWLAARHPHIGGSEIGAVLGLNKYKTARQLYEEKIGPVPEDIQPNPKMLAGTRQEPLIAQAYADITGNAVSSDGLLRVHPDYPFCSVSLDRVIADKGDSRGPGVLECKNTTSMFASTWEQDVPLPYYCQTQWGMFVSGFKWGAICVQIDGWDIRILPVERDDDFIAMMLEAAKEFWHCVETRTPPEAVADDVEKMTVEAGKQVQADESIANILSELAIVRANKKASETAEELLTDALKLKIGNAESVVDGDKVLVTYKLVSVKESYRPASSYRKLDIKKAKRG
jgi:putative phage-type endonuclease